MTAVVRKSTAIAAIVFFGMNIAHANEPESGSDVRVVRGDDGAYVLMRNGEPYEVKGAGIASGPGLGSGAMAMLAEYGGNSVRTWGIEHLEQQVDGKPFLDRAHELGISVTAGIWVHHVRHGFDYHNPEHLEKQREAVRSAVTKYRDHPALLAWGLGNEMEAFEPNVEQDILWREMNHLAGIIKELDPKHPVMSVVADVNPERIRSLIEHYPNIDILGVNSYSGATAVGKRLVEAGWTGPYMLTEFGVAGTWEVALTPWDAPVEPDPGTKAAETYTTYILDRDENVGRSLGSYVFFWGHKQEATSTWFGMFLPSGEKLARVDAMAYAWSGRWPANRAPKLESLESPIALKKVAAGSRFHAEVNGSDREGDELRYHWDVRAESSDRRIGGDAEAAPPSFPDAIEKGQGTTRIEFVTPDAPGGYRLFVSIFDGKGGAAVHNLPFFVEE